MIGIKYKNQIMHSYYKNLNLLVEFGMLPSYSLEW